MLVDNQATYSYYYRLFRMIKNKNTKIILSDSQFEHTDKYRFGLSLKFTTFAD